MLLQQRHRLGNLTGFLADGHVNADQVPTFLVYDRVQGDGRLAGRLVPNDQLALSTTDGNHGIDGLDARLNGGVHGLAGRDVGRHHLNESVLAGIDRTLTVHGATEGVHDAAQQCLARRDLHVAPGPSDSGALADGPRVAHDHSAHAVLFKVQRHACNATLELQKLRVPDPG